jgi:hypothetical protein
LAIRRGREQNKKKRSSKMLKRLTISVVIVLLLCSGAFAHIGIGQAEGFSIGAVNEVWRTGGHGSAEGGNMLTVNQQQEAYNPCRGTVAIQQEGGVLGQCATAIGARGTTGVVQGAEVCGLQGQHVTNPQNQGQLLGVNLEQSAYKNGGVGSAVGGQGFVGGQSQIISSPHGTSAESQFVGAVQYTAVSGGPCSSGIAYNQADIQMGQSQTNAGHSWR